MKSKLIWLAVSVVLPLSLAWAKEPQPKFKSVEVTHFVKEEGLELSPEFSDFLYACVTQRLKRSKLFEQVIGENEVIEGAEADQSLIVQGTLLQYSKAGVGRGIVGVILEVLSCPSSEDGETPDWCRQPDRFLRARVVILRRTSREILYDQEIEVGASGSGEASARSPDVIAEERLAIALASQVASAAKKLRP